MSNEGYGGSPNRRGHAPRNGASKSFENARVLPQQTSVKISFEREIKSILDHMQKVGETSYTLPAMDKEKRKMVHAIAKRYRMNTKSSGSGDDRAVTLTMRMSQLTRASAVSSDPIFLVGSSTYEITRLLTEFKITNHHVQDYLTEKFNEANLQNYSTHFAAPKVPPPPSNSNNSYLLKQRKELPAYKYKQALIEALQKNTVVIVSGGTGCGKTTQVPQFILEDAASRGEKVRIMCTQPRRIAAVSIADRVSKERGERLGETVGYHIRLETRTSDRTILTFCTTGVLLRALSSDASAQGITHIILDEIHEREINTDYLLICLKRCTDIRPDLKIILMSATIEGNMNLFETYFQKSSIDVLRIESRLFDVQKYYLDEILAMIAYDPPHTTFSSYYESKITHKNVWDPVDDTPVTWTTKAEDAEKEKEAFGWQPVEKRGTWGQPALEQGKWTDDEEEEEEEEGENAVHYEVEVPGKIENCKMNNSGEWVGGPYQMEDGNVIDPRQMQMYMAALGETEVRPVVPAYTDEKEKLIEVVPKSPKKSPTEGAGLSKFNTSGAGFGNAEPERATEDEFRLELRDALPNRPKSFETGVNELLKHANLETMSLAEKYATFFGKEFINAIDINLVNEVIRYLADSPIRGSILVFLPGYDDISSLREKVNEWKHGLKNYNQVNVICLHSQMHTVDQNEVFKKVPQNVRKIILSTNIAEASITIEDVIFVIDTGKVKEKVFEHEAKFSQLKISPIAKSNSDQRAGRAGRVTNGFCFRLYSEKEFKEMPETQLAEMQKAAIYDVCLHAKLFAPKNMKVAEFLALAPEPPHPEAIEQAMLFLEQVGAVYSQDKTIDELPEGDYEVTDPVLTDLGRIMASLPLDPQLARLLIFGIALKCFAPILNLVALLSYRDPFVLTFGKERETLNTQKDKFGMRDFSDHLLFIRLVDEYVKCGPANGVRFCKENYLNISSMRMIYGIRKQLLHEVIRSKLIVLAPGRDMNTLMDDQNLNCFSNSWVMVQAAVAAGCYPYIGVTMGHENKLRKIQTHAERLSGLHASSHVKRQVQMRVRKADDDHNLQFVGYQELSMTDQGLALRCATVLPPATVLMFTGPIRIKHSIIEEYNIVTENGQYTEPVEQSFAPKFDEFEIEPWYCIKAKREDLQHLLRLRFKFMYYFLSGLNNQHLFSQEIPEAVRLLHTINSVLNDEHERIRIRPVEMPKLPYDLRRYPAPVKALVPNPLHVFAGTKVEQQKQDATAYHNYYKNNMRNNQPKKVIPRQMNDNINILADNLVQHKNSESRSSGHSSPGNGFQRQPMHQQYNPPMYQQPQSFTQMPMMQQQSYMPQPTIGYFNDANASYNSRPNNGYQQQRSNWNSGYGQYQQNSNVKRGGSFGRGAHRF